MAQGISHRKKKWEDCERRQNTRKPSKKVSSRNGYIRESRKMVASVDMSVWIGLNVCFPLLDKESGELLTAGRRIGLSRGCTFLLTVQWRALIIYAHKQ